MAGSPIRESGERHPNERTNGSLICGRLVPEPVSFYEIRFPFAFHPRSGRRISISIIHGFLTGVAASTGPHYTVTVHLIRAGIRKVRIGPVKVSLARVRCGTALWWQGNAHVSLLYEKWSFLERFVDKTEPDSRWDCSRSVWRQFVIFTGEDLRDLPRISGSQIDSSCM